MWTEGFVNGFFYDVKHYEEPSSFRIDGGRISKLMIRSRDRRILANYDRGWDVDLDRSNAELFNAYESILGKYN